MNWPSREVGYQPPKADIRPQALIDCLWPITVGMRPEADVQVRAFV